MDRQADLCWGQRYGWLDHYQLPAPARHELNLTISLGPPEGSTVDSIRLALDLLFRRHEGLRTTLHTTGDGGPRQRVHPPGPVPMTILDLGNHPMPEVTRRINEFIATPFDLETQWPLRACLVTAGAQAKRLVLVGHHTAMDDWVIEALKREADELHSSILAKRAARLAPVRHHPVDLARYESGAEAAETHRQSLSHWRRVLSLAPGDLFATRRAQTTSSPPLALRASLSSPSAQAAAKLLAVRYQVWPSLIYAATFTALLATYTGAPSVWYMTYAGNRYAPAYAEVMSCLFQPVPVLVDCADDPTIGELVRRTAKQCAEALECARGRYDELLEEFCRRSTERGVCLRMPAVVNHLQYPGKTRGGSRTVFNWNPPPPAWPLLGNELYLRISEWQDCVVGTLSARTEIMPAAHVEQFLHGLETLLTSQASAPRDMPLSGIATLIGLAPAPVPYRQIAPERVAALLAGHPDVAEARVFGEPAGRLTAYLTAARPQAASGSPVAGPAPDPGRLRAHLLARGYDTPQLGCPDQFVVCEQAPSDPEREDAWAAQPVRIAGDGRLPPHVPPSTAAEGALERAVRTANGLDGGELSMAGSYLAAGGRVLRIPAVQQHLQDLGWAGASVYELASARPLEAIAATLVRVDEPANETRGSYV